MGNEVRLTLHQESRPRRKVLNNYCHSAETVPENNIGSLILPKNGIITMLRPLGTLYKRWSEWAFKPEKVLDVHPFSESIYVAYLNVSSIQ